LGGPGITNRQQLAGRRIGFVGDGGLNDALVKFIIEQLAAAAIMDVQETTVPGGGDKEIEALLRGECDAIVSTPPECISAHRQGCQYLVDFADYGLNYALGGIAARRSYVEENLEITRKFIKAYVEGMHRYRTDRDFTIGVQAEYSGIADRSIAEETYDLTRPGMPAVPYPVVSSLQTLLNFMSREVAKRPCRKFRRRALHPRARGKRVHCRAWRSSSEPIDTLHMFGKAYLSLWIYAALF